MNLTKNFDRTIRHVLEEGSRVFAYRIWKLGRLLWLQAVRYWTRLDKQVHVFWSTNRIEDWLQTARRNELLIGSSHLEAFRNWSARYSDWTRATKDFAENIRRGLFSIFDKEYQFEWDNLPWHTDWRCSYTWSPAYFRTYCFYTRDKEVGCDVKFPWEISRFSFLFPLAQMVVITGESQWRDLITNVVADWGKKNPVAYSVNWFPMESAMRGITLSLVTQMLAVDTDTQPEHLAPLLHQLTLQGEFLFRNIEFSKFPNNHYTANIVSLLLMGCTLQKIYRPAARWVRYARRRISSEIERQYCEDGVNFEKSISYHRLVTELFMVALLTMDNANYYVSEVARERMRRACDYTRCYTRPDGLAPNWGDNDGARLLGFDSRPLRDHRSLLALASAFFSDRTFKAVAQEPSAAIPWLLGKEGIQRWKEMENCDDNRSIARLFQAGGMVISREGENFLIADFGEIGTGGRGGHGHNDTLSFELCLCGKPLIIDPGSPAYTGDMAALGFYRSTRSHNTVSIDGQEMARLLDTWRISDEAVPTKLQFQPGKEVDIVEGGHKGYTRLADPVMHQRSLIFYKRVGRLVCRDSFRCAGQHRVERFLHFAPGVEVTLHEDTLYAHLTADRMVSVLWTPSGGARVETVQVSENFGHQTASQRLVLEHKIEGTNELSFEITLQNKGIDR